MTTVREKHFLVCHEVAGGLSVKKSCEKVEVDRSSFFRALQVDKELSEQYTRAREARADARFERADDIAEKLERGEIDSMTARVLLDNIKWQCGKEKGRVYGDSTTIKGDKDNPLMLQALSTALDDRIRQRSVEHKKD